MKKEQELEKKKDSGKEEKSELEKFLESKSCDHYSLLLEKETKKAKYHKF